jgi:hypothetical protein
MLYFGWLGLHNPYALTSSMDSTNTVLLCKHLGTTYLCNKHNGTFTTIWQQIGTQREA